MTLPEDTYSLPIHCSSIATDMSMWTWNVHCCMSANDTLSLKNSCIPLADVKYTQLCMLLSCISAKQDFYIHIHILFHFTEFHSKSDHQHNEVSMQNVCIHLHLMVTFTSICCVLFPESPPFWQKKKNYHDLTFKWPMSAQRTHENNTSSNSFYAYGQQGNVLYF